MLKHSRQAVSDRDRSVKDDWRAHLPEEKSRVFSTYVHDLEAAYGMLSVALNEALELQRQGHLVKTCQAVNVTPQLCTRLSGALLALLRVLGHHARHYGTIPNVAPLNPDNFQSSKGQRAARMSAVLSKVLLPQRTQFPHKLGILQEIVEDISKEFCLSAYDLGAGLATDPVMSWKIVDTAHYDLNTCLRETIIMLKSFLHVLPDDQLPAFQKSVKLAWGAATREPATAPHRILHHRRMAHIAGE
ncbi:MAG: hypothetical protein M3P45_06860 [Acidobacteriota bacterium]|nr:hypothetical protein [Acidobacteriota bacterium]